MSRTIAAIVPAYNEEMRVGKVLQPLSKCSFINEVICVDDASVDGTRDVALSFPGVRTITLPANGGKAAAIVAGIAAVRSDIVVLIDADLTGLTAHSLRQMTDPLLIQNYDAVLGYPKGLGLIGPLTGERAYYRKDLLSHLGALQDKGYGLELALNHIFHNKNIRHVALGNVSQLPKKAKYSKTVAWKKDLGMYKQLFDEIAMHNEPVRFFYEAFVKHYYIRLPQILTPIDKPLLVEDKS